MFSNTPKCKSFFLPKRRRVASAIHYVLPAERRGKDALLHFLRLLRQLPLASPLRRFRSRLGVQHIIPPPEAAGVIPHEPLMMDIVVLGASPERQEMVQAPREVIAAVCVDGLEEAKNDPDIHGEDVEIAGDCAPQDRDTDGADAQDHDLDRRGVFRSHTERG